MGRRFTRLCCAGVCALLLAVPALVLPVAAAGPAAASPFAPVALADGFYLAPEGLAGAAPGDVLKSRRMPAPPQFPGVDAWQVQFRSTNVTGEPIAAVTTVLVPAGRYGGPLVSYQPFINSLGLHCAPSQALYTTLPDEQVPLIQMLTLLFQQGWSVAIPDHLGPDSAYGVAKLGGLITLDGIRAAQRFEPLALAHGPVGMLGYSGGGMATAFAAALAPSYAPELRIVGSAQGGVPADLVEMGEVLGFEPHPLFGLAMAVALGMERIYPDQLPISAQLNPRGRELAAAMANACVNQLIALGANTSAADVAASRSLVSDPVARQIVRENSVADFDAVPTAPIFDWTSPSDSLVSVRAVDRMLGRWCAGGASVVRHPVFAPDHLTAAAEGLPAALGWLGDRFADRPTPTTC